MLPYNAVMMKSAFTISICLLFSLFQPIQANVGSELSAIYTSESNTIQHGMGMVVLDAGTPVLLEISQTIQGKYLNLGQAVSVRSKFPVKSQGKTVIAAGAIGTATVMAIQKPRSWGRAGHIQLKPVSVMAVDGQQVLLAGTPLLIQGEHRMVPALVLGILFGFVLIGIIIGFSIRGKQASLGPYHSLDTRSATDTDIEHG